MFLDPAACTVTMLALLVGNSGVVVGAEPHLSGTILGSHGHERHIHHEGKWDRGVIEICVVMDRLGHGWRCFGRRQSCITRHESQRRPRSKLGRSHLRDNRVYDIISIHLGVSTWANSSEAY